MMTLIETLKNNAKKNHDVNGNAVYKIPVQIILDHGYSLGELRKEAKQLGIRFVQNESKIRIQSANLNATLTDLLTALKQTS